MFDLIVLGLNNCIGFKGMYFEFENKHYISICNNTPNIEKPYIFYHELGHMYFNNVIMSGKKEDFLKFYDKYGTSWLITDGINVEIQDIEKFANNFADKYLEKYYKKINQCINK